MSTSTLSKLVSLLKNANTNPSVASMIVSAIDNPDSGTGDISKLINSDPILSANIIRIANSNYYGLPGRVSNLNFAVSILGLLAIRSIALASLLRASIDIPTQIWHKLLANSIATAKTAEAMSLDRSFGLTGGLLADFGEVIIYNSDRDTCNQIQKETLLQPLAERGPYQEELELIQFGVTHSELSNSILTKWGYPDEFCNAIAHHHHEPIEASDQNSKALYWGMLIAQSIQQSDHTTSDSLQLPSPMGEFNFETISEEIGLFIASVDTP
ncbi:HDOD domain-containing protein [Acidithrix ferrooxidans]|uniref:HDOD domain protein n=1 Tax=Acidithrix ferrooxidans TaxID=1280514 RepID=A0A0D8HH54_9ACTN|nr:HDOD domain-containing protein [Acidithrix ferrooxidans]KJF17184.1 HDOD domain protein [Acidithrix ferrooxidans]